MSPNNIKLGAAGLVLDRPHRPPARHLFGGDDGDPRPPWPSQLHPHRDAAGKPAGAAAPGRGPQPRPAPRRPRRGGEGTYTVKAGDSLGAIAISLSVPAGPAGCLDRRGAAAQRHRRCAPARRRARCCVCRATLHRGRTPRARAGCRDAQPGRQRRRRRGRRLAPPADAPRRRAPHRRGRRRGTYTVVSGDNPGLIAEKLGVPAAQQSSLGGAAADPEQHDGQRPPGRRRCCSFRRARPTALPLADSRARYDDTGTSDTHADPAAGHDLPPPIQ